MRTSRSEFIAIRGSRFHVRRWGQTGAPRLVMLHGWLDMSATFQFVVDALSHEWDIVAPDWRGFGLSERRNDIYHFADYLADLDALLDHYSPGQPVQLVAHSMGGNVASLYAGIRPERIGRLVNLEGLAPIPAFHRGALDDRLRLWLDQVRQGVEERLYPDREAFIERLMEANPRLPRARAEFLSRHFGREREDGRIETAADPWHRIIAPIPFHREKVLQLWRNISAPVLIVHAGESHIAHAFKGHEADWAERLTCIRDVREATIARASHNMHHEHPEQVASLIEDFMLDK